MAEFASPYARTLGLTQVRESGRIVVTMPPGEGVAGRPGFLHGGAIGGLLDYAAWVAVMDALDEGAAIKPVGITVDFMRGGKMEDAHASARIVRMGRRIANVAATAWQEDEAKPIATATLKFLVVRPS
ncbi:PaaI family thioesterase [Sphingomonas sp. SUN039]|uniref:PaaI family thioesterase n=1 Tax=Sphingomonas sp. SUN039 TaxID=2937787 RepID=UPI0021645F97|nr:PaaI family thioesterase [Sphingomonas sp. SUN039]UVO54549.1 PaaI family thioesterase [Sphingomonas sp. SUN039]